MRKLLLTMLAVILSFTLSYAESCSVGDGILSYQISDCGEQSRACCGGQWCAWGTVTCPSCTDTNEVRTCSGNVSNACSGTQIRSRSLTDNCGDCTYGDWSSWNSDSCSYTQSCTDTHEERTCEVNVDNACAGTQTRTRIVMDTCGSCSYSDWSSWSTSGTCSYTQTCTDTSEERACLGNVANACDGKQTRSRIAADTCGTCTYSDWNDWSSSACVYKQSCTETSEERTCAGNVANACAGTQTRMRSVNSDCGGCSYNSWGDWSGNCTYNQTCPDTVETRPCVGNVSNSCAGVQTRTRSVTSNCGICVYGAWSAWDSSGCTYTSTCSNTTTETLRCTTSINAQTKSPSSITLTGTLVNRCGDCEYAWTSSSQCRCKSGYKWDPTTFTCISTGNPSCTNVVESRDCVDNVDNACGGLQKRTRTGSYYKGCTYSSWSAWDSSKCIMGNDCSSGTTQTEVCLGNVTNACGGTRTRTRTVKSNCGGCTYNSYGAWNNSGCTYESSCTDTSKTIDCNTVGGTSGTISASREITGNCGECTYTNWTSAESCTCASGTWNDTALACLLDCSETNESRTCVGNVTNACGGSQTRARTIQNNIGECSYNDWGGWNNNGCIYPDNNCNSTSESRSCAGNVDNACSGTQTRTRSVTDNCGSCTYGDWSSWSNTCTYTQSCTDTSKTINCSDVYGISGSITATRSVTNSCGSCTYGSWSSSQSCSCPSGKHWDSSKLMCVYNCYDTSESRACAGNESGACAGTQTRSRGISDNISGCTYGSWGSWNTWDCSYYQNCTDTSDSRMCSWYVSNACSGYQTRTRSVTQTCGYCDYSSWSSWDSSDCSYYQDCNDTSETRNCLGNVANACGGTQTRTRDADNCGSCSYGSWSSWDNSSCKYTQSCTDTSKTESEERNCYGNVSGACGGTQTRTRTCTRSVTDSCDGCTYGGWSCGAWSDWSGSCSYTQSCTATSESQPCSGNVANACAGTATRTRSVVETCGSCSYSDWASWNTGACTYTQSCTETSESTSCSDVSDAYCSGTATRSRSVSNSCGSCSYGDWSSWNTSGCLATISTCGDESNTVQYEYRSCVGNVEHATGGQQRQKCTRTVKSNCGSCSYKDWSCIEYNSYASDPCTCESGYRYCELYGHVCGELTIEYQDKTYSSEYASESKCLSGVQSTLNTVNSVHPGRYLTELPTDTSVCFNPYGYYIAMWCEYNSATGKWRTTSQTAKCYINGYLGSTPYALSSIELCYNH